MAEDQARDALASAHRASARALAESYKSLAVIYGAEMVPRVQAARLLVVGAGGVGCELLKDLVQTGFTCVEVVDMDGIDVSNLNRQFLFRRRHVGQPKSIVAAEQVQSMRPGTCQVKGVVSNVTDPRFDVSFYRSFTVVCNALDNADARRHVNRMCVAAGVPLVESGSTGYKGQVDVVIPGKTECYDCKPKVPPKTFAVCTIRSTPDKPEHCIVWAKYLYSLLFGPRDESNVLTDIQGIHESCSDEGNHARHESPQAYALHVAASVFQRDIETQISMEDLWTRRAPPTALDVKGLAAKEEEVSFGGSNASAPRESVSRRVDLSVQDCWSTAYSARVFLDVIAFIKRYRADKIGTLSFDKDDAVAMAFVAAAANLRAAAYGVELVSPFKAKGIAGNIVHAVATTNAIVAGLVVLQVLRILSDPIAYGQSHRAAFVTSHLTGAVGRQFLINNEVSKPPNLTCVTCSRGYAALKIPLADYTLGEFLTRVVQNALCAKTVALVLKNDLLFDSDDGADDVEKEMYDANLKKGLVELGFSNGCILEVSDLVLNRSCLVCITDVSQKEARAFPDGFLLDGGMKENVAHVEANTLDMGSSARKSEDDAGLEMWSGPTVESRKHALDADGQETEGPPRTKRAKVNLNDIIEL
ncbi:SUMO-activating enzyme subunit 2 [Porphyridium purpureum]|uniref:SUMO-activating enzyme subunit n=1 Tax=Porphyridium purpureum TaxID=35688 RepID=A0A5J4YWB2_PORPP|nr:SUMO-activating enzyme subunit 2 [Porphyridium purpureum]|eukprot:POR3970..scf227_4